MTRHCTGSGGGAARLVVIALASLLWLAACGGRTDSSSNPDAGSGGGSQSPTDCDTGGIEGGGRHKLSGVVADVKPDGHLIVGRTNFAANGAHIFVDGEPASLADLHKGDVVTVTGTIDATQQSGCADAVYADASIVGDVQAIDAASQSLVVLYQTVQVRADTVFAGDDGSPFDLSTLQLGDRIRVSGVPSDGVVVATRIERVSAGEGYFVSGPITELSELGQLLWINGIGVRYANVRIVGFPGGQLHVGDPVRIIGTEVVPHPWEEGITYLRPDEIAYIDYDTPLSVLPSTAFVEVGGTVQFRAFLASGEGVTWSVMTANHDSCSATNCGSIDSAGLYQAPLAVPVVPNVWVRATSVTDPKISVAVSVLIYATPSALAVVPAIATVAANSTRAFSVYTATSSPLGSQREVSWSVSGDGCSGAACGAVDANGLYHAPASLPTPAVVNVTARDVAKPSAFGSATILLGTNPNDARLQGRYAFSLTGFDGDGHMMVIGSIVANGTGQVTSGVEYINGQLGFLRLAPVTGSYAIDGDQRGFMQFQLPAYAVGTLSLVLSDVVDGVARAVRVTSHFADRVFVGTMRRQNEGDFSTASLAGDYAFGLEGEGYRNSYHIAATGRFAIAAGQLTEGQMDIADGGADLPPPEAITGELLPGVEATGEVRLDVSVASLPAVSQFIGFIVSAREVLLMQADPSVSTLLFGSMLRQQGGPFDAQALIGETVACLAGSPYVPSLMRTTFADDGHLASDWLTFDDFNGLTANALTGTYTVAPNGRVAADLDVTKQRMYLVEPGKAFMIDWGGRAGMLYARRTTPMTLMGSYTLASLPTSMNWWISATSAVLTAGADGTIAGTLDGDTSGRKFSGSYVLNDAGELRLSLAPEAALPTESRYLLVSDSFGLGIHTSNTGYKDGCLVLER